MLNSTFNLISVFYKKKNGPTVVIPLLCLPEFAGSDFLLIIDF